MTTTLNSSVSTRIAADFSSNPTARAAILTAAARSPFLAGMLNRFYLNDKAEISVSNSHIGATAQSTREININSNWLPGSGSSQALTADQFATLLAHELGHATLPSGYGYTGGTGVNGSPSNPIQAQNSGRTTKALLTPPNGSWPDRWVCRATAWASQTKQALHWARRWMLLSPHLA